MKMSGGLIKRDMILHILPEELPEQCRSGLIQLKFERPFVIGGQRAKITAVIVGFDAAESLLLETRRPEGEA